MTGGVITVLNTPGRNFGAGMTGGFAYVLDIQNRFVDRYNNELVEIRRISDESTEAHRHFLRGKVEEFVRETGSEWGSEVLENFDVYTTKFWLVKPKAANLHGLLESCRAAPQ